MKTPMHDPDIVLVIQSQCNFLTHEVQVLLLPELLYQLFLVPEPQHTLSGQFECCLLLIVFIVLDYDLLAHTG